MQTLYGFNMETSAFPAEKLAKYPCNLFTDATLVLTKGVREKDNRIISFLGQYEISETGAIFLEPIAVFRVKLKKPKQ